MASSMAAAASRDSGSPMSTPEHSATNTGCSGEKVRPIVRSFTAARGVGRLYGRLFHFEQHQRASGDLVDVADVEARLVPGIRQVGVCKQDPAAAAVRMRQHELHDALP